MPITPTSTKSKQYQALGIDEIANDIDTAFTEVNSLQEQIDNLPQGGTTEIVNISSAQILAMGTTPIELLPAPGAGKYYEYSGYIEFNGGTTGYTVTDDIVIGSVSKYGGSYLSTNLIAGTDDVVMGFSNLGGGQQDGVNTGVVVSVEQPLNEAISLFTYNQTDPTLGDGTLRVIITYTTRTFGA